jgi:hypothetical protein
MRHYAFFSPFLASGAERALLVVISGGGMVLVVRSNHLTDALEVRAKCLAQLPVMVVWAGIQDKLQLTVFEKSGS